MSRKGNVGQCALYPETFEPGIIASDVLRIRTNAEIVDPLFLQQMLHHSESVKRSAVPPATPTAPCRRFPTISAEAASP